MFDGKLTENPTKEFTLGTRALRNELVARQKEVLAYSTAKGKPEQGLIVLIKPTKHSSYGNLVDVLDEMAIVDVPSYSILDIDPKETQLVQKQ